MHFIRIDLIKSIVNIYKKLSEFQLHIKNHVLYLELESISHKNTFIKL